MVNLGAAVPARETTEIVADLTGLRVLVVDDEPDTLEILCIMLNQSGADVRAATSSVEALETFSKWRPNVLISDIGMPGEDGFTLINRIRSLTPEQGGNFPAAALTAHAREEDRVKVLAAGYQTHIAKPVDSVTLSSALAGLAARRSDMNEFPGLEHTPNPAETGFS
jgi:CheY-like chemotaxis protein